MNTAQNVRPARRALPFVLAVLFLAITLVHSQGVESNAPRTENATNSADALRSLLQLQEQLHATQLALERNRQESETLAARNADAIAARLQLIEQAVATQRARDLETVQSANRLLVIVAGSFAGLGFLAMLLTAYLQWRAVNRLADFMAMLPAGRTALPRPGMAETQLVGAGVADQSNARLFGAMTHLEKRILELEHATPAQLAEKAASAGAAAAAALASHAANGIHHGDHLALLLAKGQSLLNLDKATEALACFDEALAQVPNHPEALVKKGVALEQLRQVDEALRCYDTAIAADKSLTVAYLQKGGLFNRLERYEEALRCYEEALRSQEKAPGT